MIKNYLLFSREVWSLLRPYWQSEERATAWLLLIVNILVTLGLVYMNVLWRFCMLAAVFIVIAVYQVYLNQMLQIRWRRWLTDYYLTNWLAERTYYLMQLNESATDNPDQRVSEDLRLLVDSSLTLGLGFLNATVTLVSFVGILWTLSGAIEIPFAGTHYLLQGYVVWAAVGYAISGTWLTHRIGKPLIALNFFQQRCEADFRFSLVRFRENSEGVALYRGEDGELRGFRDRLSAVVGNWWAIMRRQKRLTWSSSSASWFR